MIKKKDKKARNLLSYKLRENQFIGCAHWYLTNKDYGYNLFKLKDLQIICLPSNFLNYAANFIDTYAKRSTKAIFGESELVEQANDLLSKIKYKLTWNTLVENNNHYPGHYINNRSVLMNLMDLEITDIKDLITDENQIKSLSDMVDEFGDWSAIKHTYLKKQICNKNTINIKEYILKRRNLYKEWEFNPNLFHYDEEYDGYEVAIDETLNKTQVAGYRVFVERKHQYNFYS